MNDGHTCCGGAVLLESCSDRCGVEVPRAQGTGERSTPFGELEAVQVGVQPCAPSRSRTRLVDLGAGFTRTDDDHDTDQDGPQTTVTTPHARPLRTLLTTRRGDSMIRDGRAVGRVLGEPSPGPSLHESSAPADES